MKSSKKGTYPAKILSSVAKVWLEFSATPWVDQLTTGAIRSTAHKTKVKAMILEFFGEVKGTFLICRIPKMNPITAKNPETLT